MLVSAVSSIVCSCKIWK